MQFRRSRRKAAVISVLARKRQTLCSGARVLFWTKGGRCHQGLDRAGGGGKKTFDEQDCRKYAIRRAQGRAHFFPLTLQ